MKTLGIFAFCVVTAIFSVWAQRAATTPLDTSFCPAASDSAVTNLLAPVRKSHQVPAIAAALVTSKGLVTVGVVGTRKRGTETAATLQDHSARFIADQLRGARGEPALLKAESYKTLHTPPFGGDYALGWLVVERPWGGGKVLNHGGDNTMNFASVWMAPRRDFAMLAFVNQSGNTAFQATDEAVGELIKLHARGATGLGTTREP